MVKTTLGQIGFPFFLQRKGAESKKKIEKSKIILNLRVVSLAKWAVLGKVTFKQMYPVKPIQGGAGMSASRTLKVPAYTFCLTAPFSSSA